MAAFKMDSCHEQRYWEIYIRHHARENKKNKEITKRTSRRTIKVGFLTCNEFIFYKNLLCRL